MNLSEGFIINGKYRIIELIGGGAMGKVYKAENINMNKPVALKILHGDVSSNEEYQKRFMREARCAAALEHSNICRVMDADTTETGLPYIVMELLTGETLTDRIKAHGSLSPLESVRIMRQLMGALSCAHEAGIVHRDVKPDNIFLIQCEGRSDFVKLIDFGIAHVDNPDGDLKTLTQAGTLYGTPQYTSPEQAECGAVDFRADLYAAGIIFYEMLTGVTPFTGRNYIELLMHQVNDPPPHISDKICQSARIDAIIQHLLKKKPDGRYASALEVLPLLDELIVLMSAECSKDSDLQAAIASCSMNLDVKILQNVNENITQEEKKEVPKESSENASFFKEKRLVLAIIAGVVVLILALIAVIVVKVVNKSETAQPEVVAQAPVEKPLNADIAKNVAENDTPEEKAQAADDVENTENTEEDAPEAEPEIPAPPFDVEATEFKISVDEVLRHDPKMLEAYEFFAAKKYSEALVSMDSVKDIYWKHPNFLRLYVQLCRKNKNSSSQMIAALAQIMSIEPNAVRNSVIRAAAFDAFEKNREELEAALVEIKSEIAFQSCALLVVFVQYQDGPVERVNAIRETMNAIPEKKIPAWMHEAMSFHEFPMDDCDSRLKTVQKLWTQFPNYREVVYSDVIEPLSKLIPNGCKKGNKKIDCYGCMREWVAKTQEDYQSEKSVQ